MAGSDHTDTRTEPTSGPDDAELRQRLTPLQYDVTQNKGTERAFTGELWDNKADGTYRCVVCGNELFTSDTKYESGTGWPSFTAPVDAERVTTETDRSWGMVRTEAMCAKCGAHLGHVFPDGPGPAGERWCMNSASFDFEEAPKAKS